jgi:hypothetical protein
MNGVRLIDDDGRSPAGDEREFLARMSMRRAGNSRNYGEES